MVTEKFWVICKEVLAIPADGKIAKLIARENLVGYPLMFGPHPLKLVGQPRKIWYGNCEKVCQRK